MTSRSVAIRVYSSLLFIFLYYVWAERSRSTKFVVNYLGFLMNHSILTLHFDRSRCSLHAGWFSDRPWSIFWTNTLKQVTIKWWLLQKSQWNRGSWVVAFAEVWCAVDDYFLWVDLGAFDDVVGKLLLRPAFVSGFLDFGLYKNSAAIRLRNLGDC